jgi:hypothetical protein
MRDTQHNKIGRDTQHQGIHEHTDGTTHRILEDKTEARQF